jgi:tRNA A-37 threonylcarbamoyl transferase component Bud32
MGNLEVGEWVGSANTKRSSYKTIGLVGQGQFGKVFCAIDRRTGELKALKELDQKRFPTKQFLRELRFLVSLQHPNIVACEAFEHSPNSRQLVMDYCEGGTLRNLLESEAKLNLRQTLKIIADVLQGLEYAHSQGIVHCDIKPENILLKVQPEGWLAKISDFGVARLQEEVSGSNGDTGSPAYMAPERFYGKHTYASDIYAVGVILYEMLVGERPFSGIPKDLLQAHLSQPLQLPHTIPFLLRSLITTALQKLPQARFASATEMLKSIRLAEAVNQATNRQDSLFTKTLACRELSFKSVEQAPLNAPVTQLAVQGQQVMLGMVKEAECRWYQGGVLHGNLKQTRRIGFTQSLTKIQQLADLQLTERGCWLLTKARLPGTALREFNIYFLPLTTAGFAKTVGVAQDRPELYTLLLLQAEEMGLTADPQGRWLAYHTRNNQPEETHRLAILRGENALSLKSYPSQVSTENLVELTALNHRYGLAVTAQPLESGLPGCQLQVFSRWGRRLAQLNLPVMIQQVAPSLGTPGQFLAIDAEDPSIGLLVHLYPWKVERLGLGISARWVQPTPWGYVVADDEGQVILFNLFGEKMARFQIPGTITALRTFEKFGLLAATWSANDTSNSGSNSGGMLYKIDLSKLGLDFRGHI